MRKLLIISLFTAAVSAHAGLIFSPEDGWVAGPGTAVLIFTVDGSPYNSTLSPPPVDWGHQVTGLDGIVFPAADISENPFAIGQVVNWQFVFGGFGQGLDINTVLGLNQPIYVVEVPEGLGWWITPEPGTCLLLAGGTLMLGRRRTA